MFIYWRDQCKYCVNQNCGYKEGVKLLTEKIITLGKETKDVYGSISFKCDYFVVDEEKVKANEVGNCPG